MRSVRTFGDMLVPVREKIADLLGSNKRGVGVTIAIANIIVIIFITITPREVMVRTRQREPHQAYAEYRRKRKGGKVSR